MAPTHSRIYERHTKVLSRLLVIVVIMISIICMSLPPSDREHSRPADLLAHGSRPHLLRIDHTMFMMLLDFKKDDTCCDILVQHAPQDFQARLSIITFLQAAIFPTISLWMSGDCDSNLKASQYPCSSSSRKIDKRGTWIQKTCTNSLGGSVTNE